MWDIKIIETHFQVLLLTVRLDSVYSDQGMIHFVQERKNEISQLIIASLRADVSYNKGNRRRLHAG